MSRWYSSDHVESIQGIQDNTYTTVTNARASAKYVAPRTLLETEISEIWVEILGVDCVGVDDNFFELGGSSLMAIQLVTRLRAKYGVNLPLTTLFHTPQISDLVLKLGQLKVEFSDIIGSTAGHIQADSTKRFDSFPMTDLQQAYWLGRSSIFSLGNIASHSYTEFEIENVDLDRFEQAWRDVIRKHDMLRMVVQNDGNQKILQYVPPYEVKRIDLRRKSSGDSKTHLHKLREEMSHQILDPLTWPLFDVRVCMLANERFILLVSFDRLIRDAWSWGIIWNDLNDYYFSVADTENISTKASFRDYVLANELCRDTPAYQASWKYWQERAIILPPAPSLPLKSNIDKINTPRFERLSGRLEKNDWKRLKAIGLEYGLTPSGVLLAAFAEVLAAFCEEPHFTVNLTHFSHRLQYESMLDVVGDFTSIGLLEVDYRGLLPFEVRARRLQEQLWRDLEHNLVNGVQVLREIGRIDSSIRPIFPVVFTSMLGFGGLRKNHSHSSKIKMNEIYSISQTSQVILDHQVEEEDEDLVFNWDIVIDLFPEGLIQTMFEGYVNLLSRLTNDSTTWKENSLTQPLPQPSKIVAFKNKTMAPLMHELFTLQVSRNLNKTAIYTSNAEFSYKDVQRGAEWVSQQLLSNGVKQGDLVAIIMDKGWEQVVAVLGILMIGAAYVPIDPTLPGSRIKYLIGHCSITAAITQPWMETRVEWPDDVVTISVDESCTRYITEEKLPPIEIKNTDLAYVIYTSGSTGLPKGVMIDHRGAVNTVLDINSRFSVKSSDRIFALSSLSFDLSVYDIFGALAAGAGIVLPDSSLSPNPDHWLKLIQRAKITVWNSVPALMELLIEHLENIFWKEELSIRLVFLSGDWIPITLPKRIISFGEKMKIISLGGATEASIWSIYKIIDCINPNWTSIPYGRALANQSVHVLNHTGEVCPVWVPGELFIGGLGVALGYWRDSVRTSERFLTHPKTGERLYHTGDLGRKLPDGDIEFLGRRDFQVKVQGHRIELGEIEASLLQHYAVQAAVVLRRQDSHGRGYLVAFVTLREGILQTSEDLRQYLGETLPGYMVPSSVIILSALPLTANGKLDRNSLISLEHVPLRREYLAPRTSEEARVARIWCDVLQLQRVSVLDNFFEMGGHSLTAIKVIREINKAFEIHFTPKEFFQTPSLDKMALAICEHRRIPVHQKKSLEWFSHSREKIDLFVVPAAGLTSLSYTQLQNKLDGRLNISIFDPPGIVGEFFSYPTVVDAATNYVRELKKIQTIGPYHLIGHSYGGSVAFEMVRILEREGSIANLILLDSDLLINESSSNSEQEKIKVESAITDDKPNDNLTARLKKIYEEQLLALSLYVPSEPIKSRTAIILAKHGELIKKYKNDEFNSYNKWILDEINLVELEGGHLSMLENPHVEMLADALIKVVAEF